MIYRWLVRKAAQAGWQRTFAAPKPYATPDGELIYRAVQYARITWGKLAEETIQPDTQLLVAALARETRAKCAVPRNWDR